MPACAPRSRRAKRERAYRRRMRAEGVSRRQQPPHAQSPVPPRRAHGRNDRGYRRTNSCPISTASPAETNEALARMVVSQSAGCPAWMGRHGVRFQSSLRGTLHLGRTNAFFLGGGKALMNSYYGAAARSASTSSTTPRSWGSPWWMAVRGRARRVGDGAREVRARAVVLAAADSSRTSRGCARSGARRPTTSSSAARRTTGARSSG